MLDVLEVEASSVTFDAARMLSLRPCIINGYATEGASMCDKEEDVSLGVDLRAPGGFHVFDLPFVGFEASFSPSHDHSSYIQRGLAASQGLPERAVVESPRRGVKFCSLRTSLRRHVQSSAARTEEGASSLPSSLFPSLTWLLWTTVHGQASIHQPPRQP